MGTRVEQLADYDATDLARAIQQRQLAAVDVVHAYFERIEKLNSNYNAFVTLDKANALQRAEQADRDLAEGKCWGPLHGVPISIKDAFETAGLRTTSGHRANLNFVPERDSHAVSRLKQAGAIVIGKTNCATLCSDIQTTNQLFGTTNNPWSTQHTAGGSSGGEAVAVALGLSAMGLGSDTAGSIRIPSGYCGVYGFKPSFGKIERSGLRPLHAQDHPRPDSLTVVGPIARSVRDLMLCYEVLSGERVAQEPPPVSLKVFWTHRFAGLPVADEVSQLLDATLQRLSGSGLGVQQIDSPLDMGLLNQQYAALCMYEFTPKEFSYAFYGIFFMSEWLRSFMRGGLDARYQEIKKLQTELSASFEAFLAECDCWVLPATPSTAFLHQRPGLPIPMLVNGKVERCRYLPASAGCTAPISFLGNPSVVIPVGKSSQGMPVAVQVVGKRGADAKLLRDAALLAAHIGQCSRVFACC